MIAAIYARKSNEQRVADDAKSVTRQVDLARVFATGKGWLVAEERVYLDDGISGAEFKDRPGLASLLLAAKSSPRPFDVVVAMDESRLGRDQFQTAYVLQQIADSGIQLWYYQEARQAKLDDATGKFLESVRGFASEMEREKARARTREAMRSKAKAGHVAGGRVYGYVNVREGSHVHRVIVDEQAAIVRRIFQEIAEGRGFARIAQGLNRDGIPAPRAGGHWAMTGVREMVFRELYRGRIVYGKTRWTDRGGTKVKRDCPEAEWLTLDAPTLRIVPETLWNAAHARLDRTRKIYLRQTGGKLWGRPEAGIEARHLLSGFVVCGVCDGAMHAIKRTSRRGEPRVYYVCNGWRVNGACTNALSAHLPDVDAAVLAVLRRDVLTPDVLEDVINRAVELYRSEPDAAEERHQRLTSEAGRLRTELSHYAEAIGAGGAGIPSILEALRTRERRLTEVKTQLEHLDDLARLSTPRTGEALTREIRARLSNWAVLVGQQPAVARQILRKLLVGRLRLTPKITEGGRWYEFSGRASYGALLNGSIAVMVPPG